MINLINAKMDNLLQELEKEIQLPNEELEKEITDAIKYSLISKGKRLRPQLLLRTYESCGGENIEEVYPFALALELIHVYSLVHDDLPAMDNDDFRHGKPTNHKIFGEDMAILVGDYLQSWAFDLMAKNCDNQHKLKAMQTIVQASKNMVLGQAIDIKCLEQNKELILKMYELKTGALIRASILSGAILAECGNSAFDKIAYNLGLAFQIQDDILEIESTQEKLGKPVDSDSKNGKSTYVTYVGTENAKIFLEEVKQSIESDMSELDLQQSSVHTLIFNILQRDF